MPIDLFKNTPQQVPRSNTPKDLFSTDTNLSKQVNGQVAQHPLFSGNQSAGSDIFQKGPFVGTMTGEQFIKQPYIKQIAQAFVQTLPKDFTDFFVKAPTELALSAGEAAAMPFTGGKPQGTKLSDIPIVGKPLANIAGDQTGLVSQAQDALKAGNKPFGWHAFISPVIQAAVDGLVTASELKSIVNTSAKLFGDAPVSSLITGDFSQGKKGILPEVVKNQVNPSPTESIKVPAINNASLIEQKSLNYEHIQNRLNDVVAGSLSKNNPDISDKILNSVKPDDTFKSIDDLEQHIRNALTPSEQKIANTDISRTFDDWRHTVDLYPKVASIEPTAQQKIDYAKQNSPKVALDAVTPSLKGKKLVGAYTSDFAEGATKGSLVTKQAAPISDETKRIASNLQDVLTSKNNINNLQNLGSAMDETEAKLTPLIQDKSITVDNEKLFGQLEKARTSMPREFQAIKDNKKLFDSVINFAQQELDSSDGTLEATRNARIAFDSQAKVEFPSAYNENGFIDTSKPAGRAIKMVRDTINNAMYDAAGSNSELKNLIGREADIFKAAQVIGQKAAKTEGLNAIGALIKKHPILDTILGTLGAGEIARKIVTGKF